jgi:hypothetical protein
MNSFPALPVDISDIIGNNKDKHLDNLQRLSQLITGDGTSALAETQWWCVSMLMNQHGLWQSVLKVMIQFMDLWIG